MVDSMIGSVKAYKFSVSVAGEQTAVMVDCRKTDGLKGASSSPDTVFFKPEPKTMPETMSLPPAARSHAKWFGVAAAVLVALMVGMCALLLLLVTSRVMMSETGLQEKLGTIPWSVGMAGFVAQLVDGSLGMGYGLTSSTILVSSGIASSTASTVVHLAQLGTTLLSGVAHYREGNVDASTLRRISPIGSLGAFLGASALSSLPHAAAKPISGTLLFLVGLYLLYRCGCQGARKSRPVEPPTSAFLAPLGFVGGFIDATGGGGWGPVATSGLLAHGGLPPHVVIGVVSLSEFFVTCACVLGFAVCHLFGASSHDATGDSIPVALVLTLLGGGLLAAPVAPMLVKAIQPEKLGALVGTFVCLTNARVLLRSFGASQSLALACYGCVGLLTCVVTISANRARAASAKAC
jgi:uncharacterized membrane protein YfcA